MRLFVAINLNEATRSALASLQEELRESAIRGRFSTRENLHLTLAFLGECDSIQTAAACAAMDAQSFAPFSLEINRLGCFRREGGEIWWAGAVASEPLLALQQDLAKSLRAAGFRLEERQFRPHITLAREVVAPEKERTVPPFSETVTRIDLMKSERIGGKLMYTAIHSIQS